ncbi:hypothetical protein FRC09_012495 [Ceratobasidium sp. 395]|nr:hypothetical protein FRC09_012495 [Ceratobasidium sp. 395]
MNLRKEHPKNGILPLEIWALIALELHDTRSLACLCRVSTQSSQALRPMLYREVHVTGLEGIQSICESITTSARQLGPLIHDLELELPLKPLDLASGETLSGFLTSHPDLILNIQAALRTMLNLTILSVQAPPNDFDAIFKGISLPFQLNKLLSQFPPNCDFLRSQPSITTLEIGGAFCNDYTFWYQCCDDPDILPSLRHFKAPDDFMRVLVPGRPVTKVVCIVTDRVPSHVFNALIRSSSDVVWLESVNLERSWEGFVQQLAASDLKRTLKRLCLKLELQAWPQDSCQPEQLSEFLALERLDFNMGRYSKLSEQDVSDWLGNMSTIDTWQSFIPSLRVVTAFGRVIE